MKHYSVHRNFKFSQKIWISIRESAIESSTSISWASLATFSLNICLGDLFSTQRTVCGNAGVTLNISRGWRREEDFAAGRNRDLGSSHFASLSTHSRFILHWTSRTGTLFRDCQLAWNGFFNYFRLPLDCCLAEKYVNPVDLKILRWYIFSFLNSSTKQNKFTFSVIQSHAYLHT